MAQDEMDNLHAILLKTVNLKCLSLYRIPSLEPVRVASMTCASTLRQLSFTLSNATSLMVLPHLSRFTRLTTLYIQSRAHVEVEENAELSDSASLDMPCLEMLELFLAKRPSAAILRFFCRSKFPAVETLVFECDTVGQGNAPYISEFLATLSLETAYLVPHDNDEAIFVPHVKTNELHCPVTQSLLIHLQPQVHTLHLDPPTEFDHARPFFDALLVSSTGVQDIYLEDWEWCTRWTPIGDHDDKMDPDNALARVRLIQYACALVKKGINLFDGYGRTMPEYFN